MSSSGNTSTKPCGMIASLLLKAARNNITKGVLNRDNATPTSEAGAQNESYKDRPAERRRAQLTQN